MPETPLATRALFDERKKFLIIGITGRTGSGCSTTAQLMTRDWVALNPPKPQSGTFHSNEERKYRILYDFAKRNWLPFKCIRIKDIITSHILYEPFEEFSQFAINLVKEHFANEGSIFDEHSAHTKLMDSLCEEYNHLHNDMLQLPKLTEDDEMTLLQRYDDVYNFYFTILPNFSDKLKSELQKLSKGEYTRIYQTIGDNIRSSGNAINMSFSPSNLFTIAKNTNQLIKLFRHIDKDTQHGVRVVIDAIRNPFEATFFRDRYSAFYLLSVNCQNEDRVERFRKCYDLSPSQIEEIDRKEYKEKPIGHMFFVSQNLSKCIELADIYFPNPTLGTDNFSGLKRQIIWYVSLMLHPGLVTPTSYEHAMQIAYSARLSSGCISRQIGAVVTDQYFSIKSVGWNNPPQGQVPCILRSLASLLKHDDKLAYSFYEANDITVRDLLERVPLNKDISETLEGRNLSFCFKDLQNSLRGENNQVHTRSLHAEENAFLQISKSGGQGLRNGILFTTASPCELCSKKAYQLGISKIYYIDPYPGIANDHILRGGSKNPELVLFSGAIGRAYHQLFQPILPYKDELEMLLGFKWPEGANEKEALRKQVAALQAENEGLRKENMKLRKCADVETAQDL